MKKCVCGNIKFHSHFFKDYPIVFIFFQFGCTKHFIQPIMKMGTTLIS